MNHSELPKEIKTALFNGAVILALPLALDENRQIDKRRQRALLRYYLNTSSGGVAVAVHTTQFEIRLPEVDLYWRELEIAKEEFNRFTASTQKQVIRIADVIGKTVQATKEAKLVLKNDYHAVLLGLAAFGDANNKEIIVGGLLGHWAVWIRAAVKLHEDVKSGRPSKGINTCKSDYADSNAAFFDSANNFAGCIVGFHEVLRRQGMLEGLWTLNKDEILSPGQMEEINRVYDDAYLHLNDDEFIVENLSKWLS
jgi:hypothetical protein